jgi:hypothetical protein
MDWKENKRIIMEKENTYNEFWNMTPISPVEIYQRFRRTHCLHPRVTRVHGVTSHNSFLHSRRRENFNGTERHGTARQKPACIHI